MAQLHPRTLLEDDVKSRGEVKVFRALRDGLDDEWLVFHSVSWIDRDPGTGAEDADVDFVLAHPDKGIVCLEVKGGDLECRHGAWYRRDERLQDPFTQALDHRYALERLVSRVDRLAWKGPPSCMRSRFPTSPSTRLCSLRMRRARS